MAEIREIADNVRQQLLRVTDVYKVELFGVQDEKIYIEIPQKRLAQLGLDLNAVLAQLGSAKRGGKCRCAANPFGCGSNPRARSVSSH
jgi:multidrug efflux pump subunit AcrB